MVATGASLTAVMLMVAVSIDCKGPPLPLLPPSLTVSVSVALAPGASLLLM